MKNVIIYVNGSNDLYSPLKKEVLELIRNIKEEMKIAILYKLSKINMEFFTYDNSEEDELIEEEGLLTFKNEWVYNNNYDVFYKKENGIKIVDLEKFIQSYISEEDENVIIISGHGGPFQALLDMSKPITFSKNTRILCNEINKFPIDLLFLDMCSMSYIEPLYELLYKDNIKNIITFKGVAPFNGVSYMDIIEIDVNNMDSIKAPLILLNKTSKKRIESVKKLLNILSAQCFSEEPTFDMEALKKEIECIYIENEEAKKVPGNGLVFIKNSLTNVEEKNIYTRYEFSKDNLFSIGLCGIEKDHEVNYIELEIESLEHIIWLHNPEKKVSEIKSMVEKFIEDYKINKP